MNSSTSEDAIVCVWENCHYCLYAHVCEGAIGVYERTILIVCMHMRSRMPLCVYERTILIVYIARVCEDSILCVYARTISIM